MKKEIPISVRFPVSAKLLTSMNDIIATINTLEILSIQSRGDERVHCNLEQSHHKLDVFMEKERIIFQLTGYSSENFLINECINVGLRILALFDMHYKVNMNSLTQYVCSALHEQQQTSKLIALEHTKYDNREESVNVILAKRIINLSNYLKISVDKYNQLYFSLVNFTADLIMLYSEQGEFEFQKYVKRNNIDDGFITQLFEVLQDRGYNTHNLMRKMAKVL